MPSASIAHAMVLAVYMPPQAPAPGHECRTMSERLASSIRPAEKAPAGGEGGQMIGKGALLMRPAEKAPVEGQQRRGDRSRSGWEGTADNG